MPYIREKQRERLRTLPGPQTVGELNYAITQAINQYFEYIRKGVGSTPMYNFTGERMEIPLDYSAFNGAIGALECAKLELYRRMVVPYEDRKIEENGDVYDGQG